MIRRILIVTVVALSSAVASADVLVYKDGHSLEGTLVSRDEKQIVFDCQRGPATIRLILKPEEIENVRTTPFPQPATQPIATTQEATTAPDAFGAMQSVAIQAKRELKPIPPVPANATQAQRGKLEEQRSVKWEEMRTRVIAIRDGLNGQQCMVSGTVEDVVAKDGAFVVLLSSVAYTPPADLSEAQSLAAAAVNRGRVARRAVANIDRNVQSQSSRAGGPLSKASQAHAERLKRSIKEVAQGEAANIRQSAANASQAADADARANRLYHSIYLFTDDPKSGELHKGDLLPMALATIREARVYLAERKEITPEWDGRGNWDKPLIVQCVAVAE